MHDKFIIYGPPASGKSTLLRTLPKFVDNCTSIDLELIESKESRIALIQCLSGLDFKGPLFVGAADLAPKEFPPIFRVVTLLYNEKSQYIARVARRIETNPNKANQNEEHLFACFTNALGKNPNWTHVDPVLFEDKHELMAQHVLQRLGIVKVA